MVRRSKGKVDYSGDRITDIGSIGSVVSTTTEPMLLSEHNMGNVKRLFIDGNLRIRVKNTGISFPICCFYPGPGMLA